MPRSRVVLAFFVAFAGLIAAYAQLAWRMDLVPEAARPITRTILWPALYAH